LLNIFISNFLTEKILFDKSLEKNPFGKTLEMAGYIVSWCHLVGRSRRVKQKPSTKNIACTRIPEKLREKEEKRTSAPFP
jgi:hypothetical protein